MSRLVDRPRCGLEFVGKTIQHRLSIVHASWIEADDVEILVAVSILFTK